VTYEVTGFPSPNVQNPLPSRLVFSYETDQVGITCITTDGDFGLGVPITGSAWYGGVLLAEFNNMNLVVFTGAIRSFTACEIPPSPAYPSLSLNSLKSFRPDGRLLGDAEVYFSLPGRGDGWRLNGVYSPVPEVPGHVYGSGNLTMREIPEPSTGAFTLGGCVCLLSRRVGYRRKYNA
jgi:hypothetical protein